MPRDSKEKAHNQGSELHREATGSGGAQSFFDRMIDSADKAIDEVARIGKAAMEPENRSKVVAGAAVGAVASIVIPVVGPILGAMVGAGYVANREDKKNG